MIVPGRRAAMGWKTSAIGGKAQRVRAGPVALADAARSGEGRLVQVRGDAGNFSSENAGSDRQVSALAAWRVTERFAKMRQG